MGPVLDLLILALILWWVFRAFGGGRSRGEELPEEATRREGEPAAGGPATAERRPAGGAGGRPGGAAPQEPEWRRRLKEAVREWEDEQRREAGDPPLHREPAGLHGPARDEPAGVATERERRPVPDYGGREEPAYRPSPEPGRRAEPAYRPSPEPGRRAEPARPTEPGPGLGTEREPLRAEPRAQPRGREPRPLDARRTEREAAVATGRRPGGVETGLVSPRRRRPPPEIGAEGDADDIWTRPLERPSRGPARARLPRLPGRNDLERAVVHMEILGPPRGLGRGEDGPYRPWI